MSTRDEFEAIYDKVVELRSKRNELVVAMSNGNVQDFSPTNDNSGYFLDKDSYSFWDMECQEDSGFFSLEGEKQCATPDTGPNQERLQEQVSDLQRRLTEAQEDLLLKLSKNEKSALEHEKVCKQLENNKVEIDKLYETMEKKEEFIQAQKESSAAQKKAHGT